MTRMTAWVHRYQLRDLLDDSFDLFKERAIELLLAGLAPYLLLFLFIFLMRIYVIPGHILRDFSEEAFQEAVQSINFWIYVLSLYGVAWPLTFAISYIAQCRVAAWHATAEPWNWARVFRPVLLIKPLCSMLVVGWIYQVALSFFLAIVSSILMVVWIMLIAATAALFAAGNLGLCLLVGLLAVLVCGLPLIAVFLLVSTCCLSAPIAIAADHRGPFAAIGQSMRIAGSNFKAHFYALGVISSAPLLFLPIYGLILGIAYAVTQRITPSLELELVVTLVTLILTALLTGICAAFQTLVYLDGRSRAELYDLRLLAGEIGLGAEMDAAYAAGNAALTPAAMLYPNYAHTPGAPPVAVATPVTSEAPAPAGVAGLTPPAPVAGFPNYAAPPPPAEEAPHAE